MKTILYHDKNNTDYFISPARESNTIVINVEYCGEQITIDLSPEDALDFAETIKSLVGSKDVEIK